MSPINVKRSARSLESLPRPRNANLDLKLCSDVTGVIVAGVHRWGGNVLDQLGPRPLLPIALRPLVAHGVDWFVQFGLVDVCVCANSETRVIVKSLDVSSRTGVSIRSCEDVMPRGLAGCVRDAALNTAADTIVVLEGSVVASFDLNQLLDTHRREGASLTIAAYPGSSVNGQLADVPAGIYVLSKSILSEIAAKGFQDLKEVLVPKLYKGGHKIAVFPIRLGSATRVQDASSYLEANLHATMRVVAQDPPWNGFVRNGQAWVHESAKVAVSARLKGALLIGPDVRIEADALVIGPSVLGEGSVIQTGAVVSRSVLWKKCMVGRGVIVEHSLLTNGSRIEDTDFVRDTVMCP